MEFAINYSTQAAALLAAGKIEIDRFKCPDWPDLIAEASRHRPAAVHFELQARRSDLSEVDWERVAGLLEATGTPYVNLHLDPRRRDYPGFPADTQDNAQREQVVERMLRAVMTAVRRFGAERVIVENVPYRGPAGKVLRPAVEPEVIRYITNRSGCGLLLDISHARIAARHLEVDEKAYMSELPVERLRELHFTGLHWREGMWQDHLEALEADWPVLDWALERVRLGEWTRPWLLAFEYGGVGEKFAWRSESAVIATQAPRLYEILSRA
jgi:uncharacterized protein (UPF0276 family)